MKTPQLSDLLKTLKDGHPWQRKCPVCHKDCGSAALTKLVYTWEPCTCEAAPYSHLIENVYHAKCYHEQSTPTPHP